LGILALLASTMQTFANDPLLVAAGSGDGYLVTAAVVLRCVLFFAVYCFVFLLPVLPVLPALRRVECRICLEALPLCE
jgi:hypothetical protein